MQFCEMLRIVVLRIFRSNRIEEEISATINNIASDSIANNAVEMHINAARRNLGLNQSRIPYIAAATGRWSVVDATVVNNSVEFSQIKIPEQVSNVDSTLCRCERDLHLY